MNKPVACSVGYCWHTNARGRGREREEGREGEETGERGGREEGGERSEALDLPSGLERVE